MFWEIYQQGRINSAEQAATRAESKVGRHDDRLRQAERQAERLTLACQAMWELLRDQGGLTDQMLEAKIVEIDARDGQLDGKIGTRQLTCGTCGRPSNSRRSTCVFCGHQIGGDHVFEG